jgi:RNA polymerase sigma-70 factor (family 1)
MYQHLTDEQLLHMLKKDSKTAFEEIYRRYWEQMSLYVLKVIHSPEDARDIVQDVFVSIWKRKDELRICQSLKSYLLKSVLNLSLRYIERHHRRQDFLKSLAAYCSELDVSTTGKLEFQELVSKLHGVVARLPAKMQEVYVLSRDENLSHKEIARRLGIAETTVKKQVTNALKVIRTNVNNDAILSLLCILPLLS